MLETVVSRAKKKHQTRTVDIGVTPAPLEENVGTYAKLAATRTFEDSWLPVAARDERGLAMGGVSKSARLAALEGRLTPAASVLKGAYDIIQDIGGPMGLPEVSDEDFSQMYSKYLGTDIGDLVSGRVKDIDRGKLIDPELANEIYPLPEDKRWTEPVYEGAAKEKYNNYLRDLAIDYALENESSGTFRDTFIDLMFGLGAGVTDAPNIALGTMPFMRLGSLGKFNKFITSTRKGKYTEATVDNFIASAAIEPINYHAQNQTGGVMTFTESAINVGFGTALGPVMTGFQSGYKTVFQPTNKIQAAARDIISNYSEHKNYRDLNPELRDAKIAHLQADNMKRQSETHVYNPDRNGNEKMEREYQEEVDAMEEDLGIKSEEEQPTEPETATEQAEQPEVDQAEVERAEVEAKEKTEKFANLFKDQVNVLVDAVVEVFPGLRQLHSEGKIRVVRNASEIENPNHRAVIEQGQVAGESRRDGFYIANEDEIYIITDEITGGTINSRTSRAVDVILEETIFHYGLRKVLGNEEFNSMISRVLHFHKDEILSYRVIYEQRIGKKQTEMLSDEALAEEVISDIFGTELYDTNILREFMAKLGRKNKNVVGDTQVKKAVNKAFDRMRAGGRFGVSTDIRLSESEREEIIRTNEELNKAKREREQYVAERKAFEVEGKALREDGLYAKDIEVLDGYIKDLDDKISGLQKKADSLKKPEVRFSTVQKEEVEKSLNTLSKAYSEGIKQLPKGVDPKRFRKGKIIGKDMPTLDELQGLPIAEQNKYIKQLRKEVSDIFRFVEKSGRVFTDTEGNPVKLFDTGADTILERVKAEAQFRAMAYNKQYGIIGKDKAQPNLELYEEVKQFMDIIGHQYFKDNAIEFRQLGDAIAGLYDRFSGIISVNKKSAHDDLRIIVHEFFHALHKHIPDELNNKFKKQFLKARNKYIKSDPIKKELFKDIKDFDDITKSHLTIDEARYTELADKYGTKAVEKAFYKKQKEYIYRTDVDEDYRFTNYSEYVAEMMSDRYFNYLDSIDPELRGFIDTLRLLFKQIIRSLKTLMNRDIDELVLEGFMDQKFTAKYNDFTDGEIDLMIDIAETNAVIEAADVDMDNIRFSTAQKPKQSKADKAAKMSMFQRFLEGDVQGETLLQGIYDPYGNLQSVARKRDKLLTVQAMENILDKFEDMDFYEKFDFIDHLIHEVVEGNGNGTFSGYVNKFYRALEDANVVFSDAISGKYDLEIHKASQGLSNDQNAKAIWEIMKNINQQYVKDRNMSGGALQYLSDRVAKQTHNPQAIFKAAGAKWITGRKIGKRSTQWQAEKEKAFQYWKDMMYADGDQARALLDYDRSFYSRGLDTPEKIEKSLRGAFDGIVSSIHGKRDGDMSLGNSSNAHAQDAHRLYHFKRPEDSHFYNQKFGTATVIESFINDLNSGSKTIALNNTLGPLYRDAFDKIIMPTLEADAQKLNVEAAKLTKLKKSFDMTMERIEGTLSRPEHITLDFVTKVIKATVVTSKLGSTLYASMSDTALFNRTLQRLETGSDLEAAKKFFTSMPETAMAASGFFRPKTDAEKEILRLVAGDIESILGSFMSRFDLEDIGYNKADRNLQRFTNFAYTVNGMNRWNRAMRDGFTVAIVRRMGEYGQYKLSDLDDIAKGFKDDLKKMGINEEEWDVIRSATSDVMGRKVLTMDSLANIDTAKVKDLIESKGRTATNQAINREKKRLQGLYLGYLRNLMDEAILTPGIRQKNLLMGSLQPGTWKYTTMSLLVMFKSFPITALMKIAAADAKNFRAGGITQLLSVLAFTSFLQYLSRNAQNYAEGRSAIPFNSGATWLEMASKGGALGVVGDFALNPNIDDFADIIAGPVFGEAGKGAALLWKTAAAIVDDSGETDPQKIQTLQRQWFNLLKNNTPLQNNLVLKPLLEATLLQQINAVIDPNKNTRLRNQLEKRGMTLNEQRKADIFFSTLFAPQ